ncbi:MAG: CubicO group peptidase (beta-lactamase class C family) [Planctomycetota bacterium]|jgi:CubicO group peptidase (beta-lactamase class C family)
MNLRELFLAALLCSALSIETAAQLSVDTQAIDAIFKEYDRTDGPGCALGIISEGQLVYARGYGMANMEHDVPLAKDTVLRIGSTSKQFTAACAVLAEQQGKLSLDADIREYLPEMPDYGVPVTTRHLLHHTSGIRDYLTLMSLGGNGDEDYYSDEQAFQMIARQRSLNFPTGTQHLYSNSGYFLVSVIIKRATGQSLREFAEEHIFAPLKMTNSHFHDDANHIVKNRADGHMRAQSGEWKISNTTLEMCGDGGVFTTVEDMQRWDANFYDPVVGGQAFVDALQTHGKLNDGTELTYSLGLTVDQYRGLPMVSHGGAFVGFRAETIRFPEQKLSVVCFANMARINPSGLAMQVADIVLKEQFPTDSAPSPTSQPGAAVKVSAPIVDLPGQQLERFAGRYLDQASGNVVDVSVAHNGLLLGLNNQSLTLRPNSPTEFSDAETGTSLRFEPASMDGFWKGLARVGRDTLVLGPYIPWDAGFMSLDDYTGVFFSPELNVKWTFNVKANELIADDVEGESLPLSPIALDAFGSPFGILIFKRNAFNEIEGYELNAGRVQGLQFERSGR